MLTKIVSQVVSQLVSIGRAAMLTLSLMPVLSVVLPTNANAAIIYVSISGNIFEINPNSGITPTISSGTAGAGLVTAVAPNNTGIPYWQVTGDQNIVRFTTCTTGVSNVMCPNATLANQSIWQKSDGTADTWTMTGLGNFSVRLVQVGNPLNGAGLFATATPNSLNAFSMTLGTVVNLNAGASNIGFYGTTSNNLVIRETMPGNAGLFVLDVTQTPETPTMLTLGSCLLILAIWRRKQKPTVFGRTLIQ